MAFVDRLLDLISFVVFLCLDIVDICLCYAYSLLDRVYGHHWGDCYCCASKIAHYRTVTESGLRNSREGGAGQTIGSPKKASLINPRRQIYVPESNQQQPGKEPPLGTSRLEDTVHWNSPSVTFALRHTLVGVWSWFHGTREVLSNGWNPWAWRGAAAGGAAVSSPTDQSCQRQESGNVSEESEALLSRQSQREQSAELARQTWGRLVAAARPELQAELEAGEVTTGKGAPGLASWVGSFAQWKVGMDSHPRPAKRSSRLFWWRQKLKDKDEKKGERYERGLRWTDCLCDSCTAWERGDGHLYVHVESRVPGGGSTGASENALADGANEPGANHQAAVRASGPSGSKTRKVRGRKDKSPQVTNREWQGPGEVGSNVVLTGGIFQDGAPGTHGKALLDLSTPDADVGLSQTSGSESGSQPEKHLDSCRPIRGSDAAGWGAGGSPIIGRKAAAGHSAESLEPALAVTAEETKGGSCGRAGPLPASAAAAFRAGPPPPDGPTPDTASWARGHKGASRDQLAARAELAPGLEGRNSPVENAGEAASWQAAGQVKPGGAGLEVASGRAELAVRGRSFQEGSGALPGRACTLAECPGLRRVGGLQCCQVSRPDWAVAKSGPSHMGVGTCQPTTGRGGKKFSGSGAGAVWNIPRQADVLQLSSCLEEKFSGAPRFRAVSSARHLSASGGPTCQCGSPSAEPSESPLAEPSDISSENRGTYGAGLAELALGPPFDSDSLENSDSSPAALSSRPASPSSLSESDSAQRSPSDPSDSAQLATHRLGASQLDEAGLGAPLSGDPQSRSAPLPSDPDFGSDVLFIHGFVSSSSFWVDTVFPLLSPRLRARHRLLAVDLLGFGRSPKPKDCHYTVGDHVRQIERSVMEPHGVRSFHVVGHSMGCIIALAMAARHVDHVRSITLLAPPYVRPPPGMSASEAMMWRMGPRKVWPPLLLATSVMTWHEHVGRTICFLLCPFHFFWEPLLTRLAGKSVPFSFMRDFLRHTHHSGWHSFHNTICGGAHLIDPSLEILRSGGRQVAVIHGEEDTLCSHHLSVALAQTHSNITLKVVPRADHVTVLLGREREVAIELDAIIGAS